MGYVVVYVYYGDGYVSEVRFGIVYLVVFWPASCCSSTFTRRLYYTYHILT